MSRQCLSDVMYCITEDGVLTAVDWAPTGKGTGYDKAGVAPPAAPGDAESGKILRVTSFSAVFPCDICLTSLRVLWSVASSQLLLGRKLRMLARFVCCGQHRTTIAQPRRCSARHSSGILVSCVYPTTSLVLFAHTHPLCSCIPVTFC